MGTCDIRETKPNADTGNNFSVYDPNSPADKSLTFVVSTVLVNTNNNQTYHILPLLTLLSIISAETITITIHVRNSTRLLSNNHHIIYVKHSLTLNDHSRGPNK